MIGRRARDFARKRRALGLRPKPHPAARLGHSASIPNAGGMTFVSA